MTKRPKHFKRSDQFPHTRVEPALLAALKKYAADNNNMPISTALHDLAAEILQSKGYIEIKRVVVRPVEEPVEDVEIVLK